MKQLTLNEIYNVAKELIKNGENLSDYPVYLGNDDELNGIHNGWYINLLNVKDEDSEDLIELINNDYCTTNLKDKGILIS